MSLFRSRRAVAALSLAAALFLALPAPSQATGLWETPAVTASRVWSWMESLGFVKPAAPLRRMAAPWAKQRSMIDPDGRPVPGTTSTAPWAKEGSMIDPNGRPVPGTTSTVPPASATPDEGSAIDPDGRN